MADKRLVLLLAAGSLCLDARPPGHESVLLSGGAITNPLVHIPVARALCDPRCDRVPLLFLFATSEDIPQLVVFGFLRQRGVAAAFYWI